MIVKSLFGILIVVFMLGCCNQNAKQDTSDSDVQVEKLTLAILVSETENYVDKSVMTEGTVDHVCKHGGKKMFIFGESPDDRIKITVGENMSSFDPVLEGSDVIVSGIVRELRVDEDYLSNWEMEISTNKNEKGKHKVMGDGDGEHEDDEEDENSIEDEMNQIDQLRKQLEASGEDHLSFYSVECTEYTEKTEGVDN